MTYNASVYIGDTEITTIDVVASVYMEAYDETIPLHIKGPVGKGDYNLYKTGDMSTGTSTGTWDVSFLPFYASNGAWDAETQQVLKTPTDVSVGSLSWVAPHKLESTIDVQGQLFSFGNLPDIPVGTVHIAWATGPDPTDRLVEIPLEKPIDIYWNTGSISLTIDQVNCDELTTEFGVPSDATELQVYVLLSDTHGDSLTSNNIASIVIERTPPVPVISSVIADPTSALLIPVTVTFSQPITGFASSDLVVSGGTVSGFSRVGDSFTFDVTPLGPGPVTVNIPPGAAQNMTGCSSLPAAEFSRARDNTTTIVIRSGASSLTNRTETSFNLTFDKVVTGVSVDDFELALNGVTVSQPLTVVGNGANYTITVSGISGNGTLGVNLTDIGSIRDVSGNPIDVPNGIVVGQLLTIDQLPPIAVIGSAASNPTNALPIPVTVTFSESVTGFVPSYLAVSGGTISGFAGTGTTYTFNVSPTSDGVVTVDIPANVAQDFAGNGNQTVAQFSRVYHTGPPSVTALTPAVTSPTNATAVNYTVSFNESVTGVTADDFQLALNGVSVSQPLSVVGSGASYTVTVSGISGNGTLGVNLVDNGTIRDAAGNRLLQTNGSGNVTSQLLTIDQVGLTAVISSASSNPTNLSPIPVTVTFSEPVTGFAQSDLVISGGTVSGFSGSGTTYAFNLTPILDGVVSVDFPLNSAQDAAGNGNLAVPQFSRIFHSHVPMVSKLAPVGKSPTNATQADFTVTFNEAVTGVTPDDFQLALNGVSVSQPLSVVGSGASYTVTVSGISGNGTLGVNLVDNGTIRDAAGNRLLQANGSGNVTGQLLSIDQSLPSVVIGSAVSNPTNTSPIPVTVTFSETIIGFSQSDLLVSGGTTSGFTGSGTTYVFNLTPSADGVVTVNLGVNAAQDAAGNGSLAAVPFTRIFHTGRPSVVTLSPIGTSPTNATSATFSVTFNEPVTGVTADDFQLALSGVSVSQPLSLVGSGASYTVTVSGMAGNGTVGVNLIDNRSIRDVAGNLLAFSNGSGDVIGQPLVIDQQSPAVVISSTAGNPTSSSPIPVTVTFNESVTGFDQSDLQVFGATITGFTGSGTNYAFDVVPTAPGVVVIELAAGAAFDSIGNPSQAASQFSRVFGVAPMAQDGTISTGFNRTYAGTLVVTDADSTPDQLMISVIRTPLHGTVTISDPHTGSYSYTPVTNYVGADSFTFQASDGILLSNEATVTVNVRATNQKATITGQASGTVVEDSSTSRIQGRLKVADGDPGENEFQAVDPGILDGLFGIFAFNRLTGDWSYALDNQRSVTDALTAGKSVTERLVVSSRDGTATKTLVVTVKGNNDRPVITLTGQPLDYSAQGSGNPLVAIDDQATIKDVDTPSLKFNGAILKVAGHSKEDTLKILDRGNVTLKGSSIVWGRTTIATVSGGAKGKALTVTFKSTASQGIVQEVLRSIGFQTSSFASKERKITMQMTKIGGQSTNIALRQVFTTFFTR